MCRKPHLCHSEAGKMIFTYLCANNVLVGVYVIQCVIVILLNGAQRLLPAPCDTFQRSLWLEEGRAKRVILSSGGTTWAGRPTTGFKGIAGWCKKVIQHIAPFKNDLQFSQWLNRWPEWFFFGQMIFALMRSPSLFIWVPSVERSGHFPGLLTPLIFDWHGGWLVWGADSASYMVACHRCGWLCSEGDWGLVDIWKAPVLMNKDTQKTSEGVELLRIHVQAALQSGPKKQERGKKGRVSLCLLIPMYP